MKPFPFLVLVLLFCGMPFLSADDDFDPAEFVIDDHAAIIPVFEGVRRVRVSSRDEAGQWRVSSLAHLAGDEGRIKLRLPDGVPLDRVRIEVSKSDPFPYEVYQGRETFATESDVASPNLDSRTFFFPTTEDDAGIQNDSPPVVQESDLWKWNGDTLYFYNQLRGLQVYDFSDPARPVRTDSLRMPALGEDMYFHPDGRHLVLLAKRWTWESSAVGSEVVVVRHDGDGLTVTSRLPLAGNSVVESRMVGSHLYVAMRNSRQIEVVGADGQRLVRWESGLTVEHHDLSDPAEPVSAEPLNLLTTDGWWQQAMVTATPDYFLIAPRVYDREARAYQSSLHLIDIRDQSAPLEVAASVELDGWLKDKFKLRIKDDILTCVTQGGLWGEGLKTVVANYDLNDRSSDGSIRLLDQLILAPQETLFATRFDGDRVYVVTAIQIDPLFVVDLSVDDDLRLLGELKIPGWSRYLQPRGDRLLSVGVEGGRVAISQFDVSDPANMGPPLRVYLGEEGEWSWSEANYDEQAIGYFPDRGVMMLPFQKYGTGANSSQTALQILTFTDDSLEKAGVIESDFAARRATLLDEETLVSVSGREVTALNVTDLANPEPLSSLEASWPVDRVLARGETLLQLEQGYQGWYGRRLEPTGAVLRISSPADPDTVLARADLTGSEILGLEWVGDFLHVLTTRTEWFEDEENRMTSRQLAWHEVVDLRDPLAPSVGRPLKLPNPTLYRSYQGQALENGRFAWIPEMAEQTMGWGWWGFDMAMPHYRWSPPSTSLQILVIDAKEPAKVGLLVDYRIALESDGPADPEEEVNFEEPRVSGIVTEEGRVFVSFRQDHVFLDEVTEERSYRTEHQLRVAELSGEGTISVTPATGIPGVLEGVKAVGDGSGWLLLTSNPAPRTLEDGRTGWSSDLLLQSSAFDGLAAFSIDEVTVPKAFYWNRVVAGDQIALSFAVWDEGELRQGIESYPFEPTGEIGAPSTVALDFRPQGLTEEAGLLATTGWRSGQQVWWMGNPESFGDPEPAVLETGTHLYADLSQAFVELDRAVAWVPVGAYGVEAVDVSSLRGKAGTPTEAKSARTKSNPESWVIYRVGQHHLCPVEAAEAPGALAAGEAWRYQAVATVSYADWMAGRLGEAGNPDFVVPEGGDDLDGDGWSNWAEFALGMDPLGPDTRHLMIGGTDSDGRIRVTFDLPQGREGVAWIVQRSTDLSRWENLPVSEISARMVEGNLTRVTVPVEIGAGEGASFLRLNLPR